MNVLNSSHFFYKSDFRASPCKDRGVHTRLIPFMRLDWGLYVSRFLVYLLELHFYLLLLFRVDTLGHVFLRL